MGVWCVVVIRVFFEARIGPPGYSRFATKLVIGFVVKIFFFFVVFFFFF